MKKLILLASCLTPMLMTNLEAKYGEPESQPEAVAAPVSVEMDAYLRAKHNIKPMSDLEIRGILENAQEKIRSTRNAIDPQNIIGSAEKYCIDNKDSVFGDIIEFSNKLRDTALFCGRESELLALDEIVINAWKGYRIEGEALDLKKSGKEYQAKEAEMFAVLNDCLMQIESVISKLQNPVAKDLVAANPVSEDVKPEEKPAIEEFPAVAEEPRDPFVEGFAAPEKPAEPGIEPRDPFAEEFKATETAEEKPFEPEMKNEDEKGFDPFFEEVKPEEVPAVAEEPRDPFAEEFKATETAEEKPFEPEMKKEEEKGFDPFFEDVKPEEKPAIEEFPAVDEEPRDPFAEGFAAPEKPVEPGIEPRDPFAEEFKAPETAEEKPFEPEVKNEDESRDDTGLPHFRADAEPQKEENGRKFFWEF